MKRDGASDKLGGLKKANDFNDEMNHFKLIMNYIPIDVNILFTRSRLTVLFFSFVINLIILFDYFDKECEECLDKDEITEHCVCTSGPTRFQDAI